MRHALAAAVAAFFVSVGSTAAAAIVTLTYTGTSQAMIIGREGVDFFGNKVGAVADFTATFVFDEGPTWEGYQGDLLNATFTQNGIVYDFNHDGHSPFGMDINFEGWKRSASAYFIGAGWNGTTIEFAAMAMALASPDTPEFRTDAFDTDGLAARPVYGNNQLRIEFETFQPGPSIMALLNLRPTHLNVTSTGPTDSSACCEYPGVPEPSAWALMLIGFGATGSLLRQQRRRLRLAA